MQEDPIVTIGIPVMNRNPVILRVLDSILLYNFDLSKVKLVIADGLSTDGTYEAVDGWIRESGSRFRSCVLLRLKSNDSVARNACIREMEGDYFLTMDSDVIFPPNALRYCLERIQEDKTGIVSLPYDMDPKKASLVIRIVIHQEPRTDTLNHNIGMGFTFFRKGVFDEVGLFNEKVDTPNETEYSMRVSQSSFKLLFSPKVRGVHLKESGEPASSFLKRCFYQRPKFFLQYAEPVKSRTLRRLPYFGSLPIAIALGVLLILLGALPYGIVCFVYCGPAAYRQIRKTFGIKYKLISAFFVPLYVSIEFWGLVWYLAKNHFVPRTNVTPSLESSTK